jgi:hypothetical protein
MGLFQTTQTIRWSYSETNPTYMDFTLSDGYVTTLDVIYTIPVMDFPVDVTLVPTLTTYAATVTLHSGMLSILANNMVNFSETIVGKVYTNSVELCSSSEGSMRVVLPASRTASFTNVSGETVSVDINSTACIRICQFVSIASLVNLVVTSDNTMLVTYVTETGLSVQLFISSVAYTG